MESFDIIRYTPSSLPTISSKLEGMPEEILHLIFDFGRNLYSYALLNKNFYHRSRSFFKLCFKSSLLNYSCLFKNLLQKNPSSSITFIALRHMGMGNLKHIDLTEKQAVQIRDHLLEEDAIAWVHRLNDLFTDRINASTPTLLSKLSHTLRHQKFNLAHELLRSTLSFPEKKELLNEVLKADAWQLIPCLMESPFLSIELHPCFFKELDPLIQEAFSNRAEKVIIYLAEFFPSFFANQAHWIAKAYDQNLPAAFLRFIEMRGFSETQTHFQDLKKAMSEQKDSIVDILLDHHYDQFSLDHLKEWGASLKFQLLRYCLRRGLDNIGVKTFKQQLFETLWTSDEFSSDRLLEEAAFSGNIAFFTRLLENSSTLPSANLLIAIQQKQAALVYFILKHPKFQATDFAPYLIPALQTNQPKLLKTLLRLHVRHHPWFCGQHLLTQAIKKASEASIVALILPYCPSALDEKVFKDLIEEIVRNNQIAVLKVFLHYFKNTPYLLGNAILQTAIANRNSSMTRHLLLHPAFTRGYHFELILATAIHYRENDTLKLLLQKSTRQSPESLFSLTLYAIKHRNQKLLHLLFLLPDVDCRKLSFDSAQEILKINDHALMDFLIKLPAFDLHFALTHMDQNDFKKLMKFMVDYPPYQELLRLLAQLPPMDCRQHFFGNIKAALKIPNSDPVDFTKFTNLDLHLALEQIDQKNLKKVLTFLIDDPLSHCDCSASPFVSNLTIRAIIAFNRPYFEQITKATELTFSEFQVFKELFTPLYLQSLIHFSADDLAEEIFDHHEFDHELQIFEKTTSYHYFPSGWKNLKKEPSCRHQIQLLLEKKITFHSIFKWAIYHQQPRLIKHIYKKTIPPKNLELREFILCWAAQKGHEELIRYLLRSQIISPLAKKGLALKLACQHGHLAIVKALLNKAVLESIKEKAFLLDLVDRLLDLAQLFEHKKIVEYLQKFKKR